MSDTIYSVYWIHEESHTDFMSEGYIGITKRDPKVRFIEHTKNDNNPIKEDHAITILHDSLTEEEAKLKEFEYRPKWNIGWNVAKGGESGNRPYGIHTSGWTHSEESKQKRSERMKNDDSNPFKFGTQKGRSPGKGVPKPGTSKALKMKCCCLECGREIQPNNLNNHYKFKH